MPDKKLTDTEIKKALEDLVKCNNNEIDCGNCSLSVFYPRCPEEIGELALDLINRQKAEVEDLQNLMVKYNGDFAKQEAEIERLKNAYKQCAWERDIFAEDMKEEIKKDCSYLMLDIKTIKAEAYKECIEKVKALFPSDNEPYQYWEIHEGADNLLKEMVGDK